MKRDTHTVLTIDSARALVESPGSGHNRWHPDIPPCLSMQSGAEIVVDVRDGCDRQFTPQSTAETLRGLDAARSHPLTGPIWVDGAEPGDVLEIETVAVQPSEFGYTTVLPGVGLLGSEVRHPFLVKWQIADNVATSVDLPAVAIRGQPFLGVIGVALSRDHFEAVLQREAALHRRGGHVHLPTADSAVPAATGLRTIPPREGGGNMDNKLLTTGSRLFLTVEQPGALLSVGDLHFAQGDGECCGSAIELSGRVRLRVTVRKDAPRASTGPMIMVPAGDDRMPSPEAIVTTGIPVDETGCNHDRDVMLAARNAARDMLAYLEGTRGLTHDQAYVLISVAADLRISSVVNDPNPVVSLVLPLGVFNRP